MNDIFSSVRGKILFEAEDVYSKAFAQERSKTAEHPVCERSGKSNSVKNENQQKSMKTAEK